MAGRMAGFFDIDERLRELSAKGDDLERIKSMPARLAGDTTEDASKPFLCSAPACCAAQSNRLRMIGAFRYRRIRGYLCKRLSAEAARLS
jgi:hypothetical protein